VLKGRKSKSCFWRWRGRAAFPMRANGLASSLFFDSLHLLLSSFITNNIPSLLNGSNFRRPLTRLRDEPISFCYLSTSPGYDLQAVGSRGVLGLWVYFLATRIKSSIICWSQVVLSPAQDFGLFASICLNCPLPEQRTCFPGII
jgi:hypothetical protein